MTSIGAYGQAAFSANRADTTFRSIKSDLASLQASLSTGKVADTYSGLGSGARTSLSARQTLSTLEGYGANVTDATLRVKLMSSSVTQIGKLAAAVGTSLPGTYNQTPIGQTAVATSAEDALRQSIDALNQDVDGRYLFSGRATDTAPVVSYDVMMNGDGTRAGLKAMVAERKAADAGPDGLGRLTVGGSGASVTLSEEAAGLPFGLKVATASATGSGLTASRSAGPPAAATVAVAAQPQDGDAVSIGLTLPDGTTQTVSLTAKAAGDGSANTFAIGATAAETASNLKAALATAVQTVASTTLASASTVTASAAFFAGSSTNPSVRVAGPPYATATATVAGTAANTVAWYVGDDGAGSARETASVRTGDSSTVAVGARANESDFQTILTAFGALAADSFPTTDTTSQARYAALADRVGTKVGTEPAQSIQADLSIANATLGASASRLATSTSQLEDTIAGVEDADPNEIATRLLAAQTRLQASYQTTATIAKMSLVNYL